MPAAPAMPVERKTLLIDAKYESGVVSNSTAERDRGIQWDDYALHRIIEYWIIDCDEQVIEQYLIRESESKYHLARKLSEGEIESVIMTGFRILVRAWFDSKLKSTIATKHPQFTLNCKPIPNGAKL